MEKETKKEKKGKKLKKNKIGNGRVFLTVRDRDHNQDLVTCNKWKLHCVHLTEQKTCNHSEHRTRISLHCLSPDGILVSLNGNDKINTISDMNELGIRGNFSNKS